MIRDHFFEIFLILVSLLLLGNMWMGLDSLTIFIWGAVAGTAIETIKQRREENDD